MKATISLLLFTLIFVGEVCPMNSDVQLLTEMSQNFKIKMKASLVRKIYSVRCIHFKIYEKFLEELKNYGDAINYIEKASHVKVVDNNDDDVNIKKNLLEKLAEKKFENFVKIILQCEAIPKRLNLIINILVQDANQTKLKIAILRKLKRILVDNNGLSKLTELQTKLFRKRKIKKLLREVIKKTAKVLGKFFRKALKFYKRKSEKLLKNKNS